MQFARRTILLGAGVFAAVPVFAHLLAASRADPQGLPPSASTPPLADAVTATEPAFRIDGWSLPGPDAPDALWLALGGGWRTAWR